MICRVLNAFASFALAAAMLCGAAAAGEERQVTSRQVRGVVELFTSQGCSSCPAADRVIGEMSKDAGIVALAYHVDYWDYIGWVDPHGTRANTDRQRAYAEAFGTGTIYTPQVVVNGRRDVIGSRAAGIRTAVADTALDRHTDGGEAMVSLRIDSDRLHISADAAGKRPGGRPPVLMLVTYDDETRTLVDKGDNQGLTIVNTHPVRDWRILGMWDGRPLDVDIPISTLKRAKGGKGGCAAILQTVTDAGAPGPILAAAALEF